MKPVDLTLNKGDVYRALTEAVGDPRGVHLERRRVRFDIEHHEDKGTVVNVVFSIGVGAVDSLHGNTVTLLDAQAAIGKPYDFGSWDMSLTAFLRAYESSPLNGWLYIQLYGSGASADYADVARPVGVTWASTPIKDTVTMLTAQYNEEHVNDEC